MGGALGLPDQNIQIDKDGKLTMGIPAKGVTPIAVPKIIKDDTLIPSGSLTEAGTAHAPPGNPAGKWREVLVVVYNNDPGTWHAIGRNAAGGPWQTVVMRTDTLGLQNGTYDGTDPIGNPDAHFRRYNRDLTEPMQITRYWIEVP